MAKDLYRKLRKVVRQRRRGKFLQLADGDGKVGRRLFRAEFNRVKREIGESAK